mmetsp:Transcript_33004/g.40842  ORF Transcript_33004/g.40842 Transcript_33004/m.40842 type:complete len:111 (-) Transcript_33004:75-407(-)
MTVTKYLCGKIILENLRVLRKRRLDQERQNAGKSGLGSTTVYLKKQNLVRKNTEPGYFRRLYEAITRKPAQMATKNYRKKTIYIAKDDMRVIATKSIQSSRTVSSMKKPE